MALAAAVAIAAWCSNDRDPAAKGATALCNRFEARIEAREQLPSDLIALSKVELREQFSNFESASRALTDVATGSLQRDLETLQRILQRVNRRLLAAWGDESGEDLKAEADGLGWPTVEQYVMRNPIRIEGIAYSFEEVDALRGRTELELNRRCKRFELPASDGPSPATVTAAGRLVVVEQEGLGLVEITPDGDTTRLPTPPGLRAQMPKVSPDGQWLAYRMYDDQRGDIYVAAVNSLEQYRNLTAGASNASCFAWTADSSGIVVSIGFGTGEPQRLERRTLSGAAEPFPLPDRFKNPCVVPVDGDQLLVTAGQRDRVPTETLAHSLRGGPTSLRLGGANEECNEVDPQVAPDRSRVLTLRGCADLADAGLFLRGPKGGTPVQLVAGPVGAAAWSPDGRWIAFTYMAEYRDDGPRLELYLLDVSSKRTYKVPGRGFTWPAWLPAST